ncbi:MAG: hypothetical protein EPN22_01470 [Nitrospirae bacterium]|nr:MAG: hypothetical protein EPN22_01470 [Nitrospirota bacterium]
MEYLTHHQIRNQAEIIKKSLDVILDTKPVVGKRTSKQWRFFVDCFRRLVDSSAPSEFDGISSTQAAQFKFEVEDKLRRFYLRPGSLPDFLFSIMHKSNVPLYTVDSHDEYPCLAGYCMLIRDVSGERREITDNNKTDLKVYFERIIAEANDAEFRAYASLPELKTDELNKWFYTGSPAIKEIINVLTRHHKKGWVISNPLNPSTKRLLSIKVKKIKNNEAVINTMEYWYLRWWDTTDKSYVYSYRETNRQKYILRKEGAAWKISENLRPMPRASVPYRWSRRQKS